jgi:hypothetical protein
LEVGAGYSSPFIVQALADNLADHRQQQEALRGHVRSDQHGACGSFPHYTAFPSEYWSLINPRHGLLLLHSTLTNVQLRPIVLDLKRRQATDSFDQFELLSFLEPQKWRQNSATIVHMLPPEGDAAYSVGP